MAWQPAVAHRGPKRRDLRRRSETERQDGVGRGIAVDELRTEPDIEIDEEPPYALNGIAVPRCTDIIRLARKPFEQFISEEDMAFYCSRGTSGHATIELLLKGILDRRTISKEIKPYMASWDYTVETYGLEVLKIGDVVFAEVPMIHEDYRFGTRIDFLAWVTRPRGRRLSVWELKFTSTHSAATPKQTACHKLAANYYLKKFFPNFKYQVEDRYAARLTKTGKPDVRQHKSPSDEGTFLSYLNVFNDRQINKLN